MEQPTPRRRASDTPKTIQERIMEAGPLIGAITVIGGALIWFGGTAFPTKAEAQSCHDKLQVQIDDTKRDIIAIDKTAAVTANEISNIRKILERMESKQNRE